MAPGLLKPLLEGQLEAFPGKCAKIESSTRNQKTTHKLVARHPKGEGSNVSLWTLEMRDKKVYLAFCFELKKQNYFAVVNKETSEIQVEPLNDPSKVDNKFLFRLVNSKDLHNWNNLRSVADPSKYLSVSSNVLTLSTSKETLFKFKCKKGTCRCNMNRTRRLVSRCPIL